MGSWFSGAANALGSQNVTDPQEQAKSEVRQIYLVDDFNGGYDSCLAITGKELLQLSLSNLGSELWRQNYADTIKRSYTNTAVNRNYHIEVDRVDYCASHILTTFRNDDDLYMQDAETESQDLHLFALIKARKHDSSNYETKTEVIIAQMITPLGNAHMNAKPPLV